MGASRQGYNLFTKIGRKNFFEVGIFGDKWARSYVLQDTFGRYICKLIGHSKRTFDYRDSDDEDAIKICSRCFERIKN